MRENEENKHIESYKLPLYEAIQFVSTKKPDLQLRKGFLEQLSRLEKRLFPTERPLRSIKWIGNFSTCFISKSLNIWLFTH